MTRWSRLLMVATSATLALGMSGGTAAVPTSDMLVSVEWLAQHLRDSNLVLLYVGSDSAFAASHIPGARYLDLDAIVVDRGEVPYELPAADSLRATFESLGVSDDSRIVLYYRSWGSTATTRAYFTLTYLGLGDNASILNGGVTAWQKAGHEMSVETGPTSRGTLSPRPVADIVGDRAWVKAHVRRPNARILDARDLRFYASTDPLGRGMREGHVPGAVSLPYRSLFDESDAGLFFRTADELQRLFAEAGVRRDEELVTYCHIGQQATAVWFAARLLGYDVRLYDGSYIDWSQAGEPVETS